MRTINGFKIIDSNEITELTGMKSPEISTKFSHIQEDYLIYSRSQFKIIKLISELKRQISEPTKSRNQLQTLNKKNRLKSFLKQIESM